MQFTCTTKHLDFKPQEYGTVKVPSSTEPIPITPIVNPFS